MTIFSQWSVELNARSYLAIKIPNCLLCLQILQFPIPGESAQERLSHWRGQNDVILPIVDEYLLEEKMRERIEYSLKIYKIAGAIDFKDCITL